jgi:acyl-CoA oxidase
VATFDKATKGFILNTPNQEAMKFWIGGAAKTSNMSVVFAQLIDGEGKGHGVHAFVVPIRDKTNHLPLPGITLGDCGKKAGLDGIDNGFLIFKDVKVPLFNLLDRFSTVSEEGVFSSPFKNDEQRFTVQLGSLSGGRIVLSLGGIQVASLAMTIALRYAHVRT